ncbi:MAG: Uncharacterized protein G01um10148_167 [Parcubacteria group bacterium Gr01-1014_8]|nr:MAG: Uncharacterized protein G01um10148_167 [Parcubacteria group bacterium Gr01-1014_8]
MYSRSLSPNIKDKPRREMRPEKNPVGEDWQRAEPKIPGSLIAPRGIGMMRLVMKWLVAAAVAFFVGALGFFAYYFILGGGSSPASPGNIDISISGPLQIASGEPAELQVAIVNRNRTSLQLADLVVKYPNGTRSPTDLLTSLPDQRIPLGTIEPGGRRQGTVSAVFSGVEGEHADIAVELEYRLENSSAIFVATSQYQFLFASSPLSISIEGNDETVSGQPIELKVTIASNSDTPVKDVLFTGSYPFGFTFGSGEPSPTKIGGGNMWSLGDIFPGQKRTIILQGTLAGESGDERVFRFSAGTRKSKTDQTISTTLADYAHHITVSKPFLGLAVLINKEAGGNTTVAPGDSVTVSVTYQNNLQTAIADAVIVARLSGAEIDGTTVRSTDGFYRSADNVVLWDKSTTNGSLATIAPGAKGTVSFSFVVPKDEAMQALRNPRLDITVHAAGKRVSQTGVPETLQASASQTLRFASDLQLAAQGLYYTNPFGSTGPMPPKAGTETTYAIVFNVTNTTNKVENATVRATLPPYVRWVGVYSPSTEKLVFNPNDSSVTWHIGTIEPGAGIGGALPRQAAIAIGFTPSTSQIGQQPALIRSISLSGTDASTHVSVTKTTTDITTNIVGDPGFSAANATVVK